MMYFWNNIKEYDRLQHLNVWLHVIHLFLKRKKDKIQKVNHRYKKGNQIIIIKKINTDDRPWIISKYLKSQILGLTANQIYLI